MNPKLVDLVPWDAPMPHGPQLFLAAMACIVFVLSLWFVYKEVRRRGDFLPIYAFIGGGLIVIYEPLGDILVSVFYPIQGQIGWIELFGREIPMFIGVLYFWYMSVPAIYFVKRVEQGLTKITLWKLYFFTLVVAIAIELFGVNVHAWIYYGPHPYVFFGVPLWCPVSYSGFLVSIAIGLQFMATKLDRKHHWLVMLGVPFFMAGGHMVISLPAAAAMFSTDNPVWIWLGATATIGLSLLMAHVAALMYCVDKKRLPITDQPCWPENLSD